MEEFTWRVGGPQGGGIETAATLFARAVGKGVVGGHQAGVPLQHHGAALLPGRAPRAKTGPGLPGEGGLPGGPGRGDPGPAPGGGAGRGVVLYDPKVLELTLHKLPMLDHRVAEDLAKRLGQADPSLKEVLQAYAEAGVQPLPYPFEAVADRIGEALGCPPQGPAHPEHHRRGGEPPPPQLPLRTPPPGPRPPVPGEVLELNRKVAEAVYREEAPRLPFRPRSWAPRPAGSTSPGPRPPLWASSPEASASRPTTP